MLRGIFSPDNKVMRTITKFVYCFYLNVLWFICCIPIITAGASTTALFYVTLKMARDEEGSVVKQFFQAFRDNLKSTMKVWLIMLGLAIALIFDGYVFYHMRFSNAFWTILTAVYLVVVVAYLIIAMYIYPLMARFENTPLNMFKNSIMVGVRFLLLTFIMAVIYIVMAYVIINIFTPAIVFGEGLCAYLCSCLLANVLDQLAGKTGEEAEESEETEADA